MYTGQLSHSAVVNGVAVGCIGSSILGCTEADVPLSQLTVRPQNKRFCVCGLNRVDGVERRERGKLDYVQEYLCWCGELAPSQRQPTTPHRTAHHHHPKTMAPTPKSETTQELGTATPHHTSTNQPWRRALSIQHPCRFSNPISTATMRYHLLSGHGVVNSYDRCLDSSSSSISIG